MTPEQSLPVKGAANGRAPVSSDPFSDLSTLDQTRAAESHRSVTGSIPHNIYNRGLANGEGYHSPIETRPPLSASATHNSQGLQLDCSQFKSLAMRAICPAHLPPHIHQQLQDAMAHQSILQQNLDELNRNRMFTNKHMPYQGLDPAGITINPPPFGGDPRQLQTDFSAQLGMSAPRGDGQSLLCSVPAQQVSHDPAKHSSMSTRNQNNLAAIQNNLLQYSSFNGPNHGHAGSFQPRLSSDQNMKKNNTISSEGHPWTKNSEKLVRNNDTIANTSESSSTRPIKHNKRSRRSSTNREKKRHRKLCINDAIESVSLSMSEHIKQRLDLEPTDRSETRTKLWMNIPHRTRDDAIASQAQPNMYCPGVITGRSEAKGASKFFGSFNFDTSFGPPATVDLTLGTGESRKKKRIPRNIKNHKRKNANHQSEPPETINLTTSNDGGDFPPQTELSKTSRWDNSSFSDSDPDLTVGQSELGVDLADTFAEAHESSLGVDLANTFVEAHESAIIQKSEDRIQEDIVDRLHDSCAGENQTVSTCKSSEQGKENMVRVSPFSPSIAVPILVNGTHDEHASKSTNTEEQPGDDNVNIEPLESTLSDSNGAKGNALEVSASSLPHNTSTATAGESPCTTINANQSTNGEEEINSRSEKSQASMAVIRHDVTASNDNTGASNNALSVQSLNDLNREDSGQMLACSKLVGDNLMQMHEDVATKELSSNENEQCDATLTARRVTTAFNDTDEATDNTISAQSLNFLNEVNDGSKKLLCSILVDGKLMKTLKVKVTGQSLHPKSNNEIFSDQCDATLSARRDMAASNNDTGASNNALSVQSLNDVNEEGSGSTLACFKLAGDNLMQMREDVATKEPSLNRSEQCDATLTASDATASNNKTGASNNTISVQSLNYLNGEDTGSKLLCSKSVDDSLMQMYEDVAAKVLSSNENEQCDATLTVRRVKTVSNDTAEAIDNTISAQSLNFLNDINDGSKKLLCSILVDGKLMKTLKVKIAGQSLHPKSNNDILDCEQTVYNNDRSNICSDDIAYMNKNQSEQTNSSDKKSKQHSMSVAISRECYTEKG